MSFADPGMKERMEERRNVDALRALAGSLDPVTVLLAVRDSLSRRIEEPVSRVIVVTNLETAAARLYAADRLAEGM